MAVSRFIFGPFELDPLRLELRRDGIRLDVGARACRVLLVLVERAGRVVSQAELLATAWPGLHVEDVNLRVHIVALRKALSGGADRSVDITTVPREGYLFAGPVSAVDATEAPSQSPSRAPKRLSPLVGREETLKRLDYELNSHRIVTIAGAGGIGKTALALAIIAERAGKKDSACVFVDFSTSVSSLHVTAQIFQALKLEGTPNDISAHIERALKHRVILLVFDNCEHVIGDVAAIVTKLTSGTEGVSILATSREPLRVPGERVFPLEPLNCSPEGAVLTAQSALRYAAIQMFVEAAGLRSKAFSINDSNASLLGEVCRRLDGIPLAIELAAATSDTMTVREIAQRLDDRFAVLTRGTRTALPRHRTLRAAIDWSYDTLSKEEASVMCRVSVFPGRFTAVDAQAVAAVGALSNSAVHNALADLAAKSLVTVDVSNEVASFRFLETMRVYARLKLLESEEVSTIYARYVDYTLSRLSEVNQQKVAVTDLKQLHSAILDDWRTAHDWVTRTGDWHTALKLMAAGIGFCQSLNMKAEYIDRSSGTLRAIHVDVDDEITLQLEMQVCDYMAQMLIDTQPPEPLPFVDRIEVAALRSLDLSRRLKAPEYEMSALVTLTVAAQTSANSEKLLVYTSQVDELAKRSQNPELHRTAHYFNGYARHHRAEFGAALREYDRALKGAVPAKPGDAIAFDHVPSVRIFRARALWLRGEFQSSLEEMEDAHHLAIRGGHAPTIAWVAWGGGVCLYLWAGALERAAVSTKLFEDLAHEYSNPGWGRYVPSIHDATERLRHGGRSFGSGPVDWTPHAPSHADVMASIHCAFHRATDLQRIESVEKHWCAAEHFRSAGEHHLAAGHEIDAERYFVRALTTSEAQGAAAWEIRATLSLARLKIRQGKGAVARALLEPLINRFADSHANADLVHAAELLTAC